MQITKLHFVLLLLACFGLHTDATQLLMLSPIGDARNEGRKAPEGSERAVTRDIANALAHEMLRNYPEIRVLFTHMAGETITQLDKAQYANTTGTSLYLVIGCYNAPQTHITLLTAQRDNHMIMKMSDQALYPISQAWRLAPSYEYGQKLTLALNRGAAHKHMPPSVLYEAPLKDLRAIAVPAIVIDIGLSTREHVPFVAQVLAEAIGTMLGDLQ